MNWNAKRGLFAKGRLKQGERNKTETAFEQHLELLRRSGEILWYAFESIKLRLADNCFLTIDFAVLNKEGFLEMIDVKGARAIVQDDFKVKAKVAAKEFPFIFKVAYPRSKKDGGGWDIEDV